MSTQGTLAKLEIDELIAQETKPFVDLVMGAAKQIEKDRSIYNSSNILAERLITELIQKAMLKGATIAIDMCAGIIAGPKSDKDGGQL